MFDTAQMRKAAFSLSDVADDLKNGVSRVYREIGQVTDDKLSGEYAEAIMEGVAENEELCRKCNSQLEEISRLLRTYATQLDLADKKASELIQEK